MMKYIIQRILGKIQSESPTLGNLLRQDELMRQDTTDVSGTADIGSNSLIKKSGTQGFNPNEPRPGKKIPNICDFGIELRPYDGLLSLFGFEKRMKPKITLIAGKNLPANQYIDYMFKRLRVQVTMGLYQEAVATMGILMGSSAYQASAFNHVFSNGHRKESLGQVEKYLKKVKQLVKDKETSVEYYRAYLPEPNKLRPLGVPTVPGRVYSHMYNNLLTEWRSVSETGKQHGYLPSKGIITAGEYLVNNLLKEPNLYEADFKGFFDNVSHQGICDELKLMGLPESEINFIDRTNQSIEILPKKLRLMESEEALSKSLDNSFEKGKKTGELPSIMSLDMGLDSGRFMVKGEEPVIPWKDYPVQGMGEMYKMKREKTKGVPQGLPTSCSLATLSLRPLERRLNIVAYADDTITAFKSPNCDPISELEMDRDRLGYGVKPEGSRWLKKEGKGLVDSFKFLGIRYYPPRERIVTIPPGPGKGRLTLGSIGFGSTYKELIPEQYEAATRNGATLRFSLRESFLAYLYNSRETLLRYSEKDRYFNNQPLEVGLKDRYSKWEYLRNASKLLGNGKLTGGFTSRMFLNSGTLRVKQNFRLIYEEDSGIAQRGPEYAKKNGKNGEDITVFTASSYAVNDLMGMIENPKPKKKKKKKKKK